MHPRIPISKTQPEDPQSAIALEGPRAWTSEGQRQLSTKSGQTRKTSAEMPTYANVATGCHRGVLLEATISNPRLIICRCPRHTPYLPSKWLNLCCKALVHQSMQGTSTSSWTEMRRRTIVGMPQLVCCNPELFGPHW